MFILKKSLFKALELGLGLRTCFSLETRNPIFLNFKLSAEEAAAVQNSLPPDFKLRKLRFADGDSSPEYWISYNLYEIKYPKKELAGVRRVRCEINTFVESRSGEKGVFVFCGSPFVSREENRTALGLVCDAAERLVMSIYSCGKLTRLVYELSEAGLKIELKEGENAVSFEHGLPQSGEASGRRLSDDYLAFNDISFFNQGKTFDRVNVGSAFLLARFQEIDGAAIRQAAVVSPFFRRSPDKIYIHRGEIGYLVDAMHRRRR